MNSKGSTGWPNRMVIVMLIIPRLKHWICTVKCVQAPSALILCLYSFLKFEVANSKFEKTCVLWQKRWEKGLPVMSIGSKAKASSSLWTRVVCSVWSAIAGSGSAGPESGLSGPATHMKRKWFPLIIIIVTQYTLTSTKDHSPHVKVFNTNRATPLTING